MAARPALAGNAVRRSVGRSFVALGNRRDLAYAGRRRDHRKEHYPEHGRATGRGVVLASYTWSEDAQRWGSLPATERLEQALQDVAIIHPQASAEYEVGASKIWHDDPCAGGAFALFEPGQQSLLHEHVIAPEGRVHFAGEHASLAHAWIQGAIESGLRAALEVHRRDVP